MRKSGMTCFLVAKSMTVDLKGSMEKTSPSARCGQEGCFKVGDGILTPKDDDSQEERASQVTQEGHHPVSQHLVSWQPTLQRGNSGVLESMSVATVLRG